MQRRCSPGCATAFRFSIPSTLVLSAALLAGCSTGSGLFADRATAGAVILVSDQLGPHQQVAEALGARLAQAPIYSLDGDPRKAQRVATALRADDDVLVIAIGSLAARAAGKLPHRAVVFCQSFPPEDERLAQRGIRGVRAVPPALKQLQAWKRLDPRLRRVALFTGPAMRELAGEAIAAGRQVGIVVDHIEIRSDRELRYSVKRLDADVQGLWLAPDNRVLSTEVLRETLAYSMRRGMQTLVFSSQLLGWGGLLSVEADPDDIAERVLEQARGAVAEAARVVPLRRVRATVNAEVAAQLGLSVPAEMRGGRYVF